MRIQPERLLCRKDPRNQPSLQQAAYRNVVRGEGLPDGSADLSFCAGGPDGFTSSSVIVELRKSSMVAVLEHKFFLSEITGPQGLPQDPSESAVWSDMVIVETGKLPEVSHLRRQPAVRLSVAVAAVGQDRPDLEHRDRGRRERCRPTTRSAPPEGAILLKDHILDKKILDMDDHEVEVVYDVSSISRTASSTSAKSISAGDRLLRRMGLKKVADWISKHTEETTVSWMYVQPLPEQIDSFRGTSNSRC